MINFEAIFIKSYLLLFLKMLNLIKLLFSQSCFVSFNYI